jgi:hypothetical protein
VDLLVVVADKNMDAAFAAILTRTESLGIRKIDFKIYNEHNDPRVYLSAHDFLRPLRRLASHSLVAFDREGCGNEEPRDVLEDDVERRLHQDWPDCSAAIAIDPELENWVWSDSHHVAACFGWSKPELSAWLGKEGHWPAGAVKPPRPKEAVVAALKFKRIPRSSAAYAELASRVTFKSCTDPAFLKLKKVLQQWFPAE